MKWYEEWIYIYIYIYKVNITFSKDMRLLFVQYQQSIINTFSLKTYTKICNTNVVDIKNVEKQFKVQKMSKQFFRNKKKARWKSKTISSNWTKMQNTKSENVERKMKTNGEIWKIENEMNKFRNILLFFVSENVEQNMMTKKHLEHFLGNSGKRVM